MGGKGSGYFGHSREHGLHRKGISTKIDEHRRFDVSKFVARGERHKIRFKQDFRFKKYLVTIEKDKDISLAVWEAEHLFQLQLKNPNLVKRKVSDSTKEKLEDMKVINIEEIIEEEEKPESIFKAFGKKFEKIQIISNPRTIDFKTFEFKKPLSYAYFQLQNNLRQNNTTIEFINQDKDRVYFRVHDWETKRKTPILDISNQELLQQNPRSIRIILQELN